MSKKNPTLNEITLLGFIKTRVVTRNGKAYIQGSLSTTLRGSWENASDPQWHNIIPMSKRAADSLRALSSSYALVKGTYRRRKYLDDKEKTRYANEILVFDPIENAEPGHGRKNVMKVNGFLGREAHVSYPANGGPANIDLAICTHAFKKDTSSTTGWIELKTWHKCFARVSEETLEKMMTHLKEKKKFFCIEGELQYRDSNKGEKHRVAEILMTSIDGIKVTHADPITATPAPEESPEEKFAALAKEVFTEPAQQQLPLLGSNIIPIIQIL